MVPFKGGKNYTIKNNKKTRRKDIRGLRNADLRGSECVNWNQDNLLKKKERRIWGLSGYKEVGKQ